MHPSSLPCALHVMKLVTKSDIETVELKESFCAENGEQHDIGYRFTKKFEVPNSLDTNFNKFKIRSTECRQEIHKAM
jgi:hypothetical protein